MTDDALFTTDPTVATDVLEVRVPVTTLWTAPDAPRDVDAPAVAADPDVAAWTAAMDSEARGGLHGRAVTQALLGEGVRVVEERGDWVRVVALVQPSSGHPDGYPGWVPRAHLGAPVRRTDGPTAFVMATHADCLLDDGTITPLSFGTALWLDRSDARQATVLLPDDRRGRVELAHLRVSDKSTQPNVTVDDLLGSARRFLGLRYLWAGTSAWGLDCSGLVHLVYRAHGVVVPRDAYDQADAVQPVHLEDARPGDLYFFARPRERVYHVGFVTRPYAENHERWMLHAPESGELVEDAPLAEHRLGTLVSAGRVVTPSG